MQRKRRKKAFLPSPTSRPSRDIFKIDHYRREALALSGEAMAVRREAIELLAAAGALSGVTIESCAETTRSGRTFAV